MYAPICTRDLALIYLFTRLAGERAGKLTENYTRALPPLVVARQSSVRISIGNASIVGTRGVDGRYKARFEDSGVFLFEGIASEDKDENESETLAHVSSRRESYTDGTVVYR